LINKTTTIPINDEIRLLNNNICSTLLINNSNGSASSFILVPGMPKQINKYVVIKDRTNNTGVNNLLFIYIFTNCNLLISY